MSVLKPEQREAVVKSLTDGNGLRETARLTGVARETVNRIAKQLGLPGRSDGRLTRPESEDGKHKCAVCGKEISPERVKVGAWRTCSPACAKVHSANLFALLHKESRQERAERKIDKWRDVAAFLLVRSDIYWGDSRLVEAARLVLKGAIDAAQGFTEDIYDRVDALRSGE